MPTDQRGYFRHTSVCDIGAFESGARSDEADIPLSGPGITNMFPSTVQVGAPGFTLTVDGQNFGTSAGAVSFNGTMLTPVTYSSTQITVNVPASLLSTAGVPEVQVIDSASNTSNELPFYITPKAVSISAYTSNADTGNDTASVNGTGAGTPYGISAQMVQGAGDVIQVAQFTSNPTSATLSAAQDYFDVHLAGTPSSVVITDCTPGDNSLDYYNPIEPDV